MNRIVVLGVAMFFALVGIALIGGENKASAFFGRFMGGGYSGGCDGCSGCNGCNGGHCHGNRCHGRDRCHGNNRCHGRDRCNGRHQRCNGGCNGGGCNGGGCCGGYAYGGDMKGAVQAPMGPEKQAPIQGPAQVPAK